MYLFPNLAHSGVARNGKGVCSVIAKVAMYLFPNLAHSGVARNGKGVCSVIAKSGNVSVSKSGTFWSCQEWQRCVLSDCQKWQCICFQIWHILELPGMAKVCAQ